MPDSISLFSPKIALFLSAPRILNISSGTAVSVGFSYNSAVSSLSKVALFKGVPASTGSSALSTVA